MYRRTTATEKILKLSKRIRAVAGGSSASKTVSILMFLIDYAQAVEGDLISVVSESMPHLRKGAMRDFENIMKAHNYWNESCWNRTNSIYTFPETGSQIEFFGANDSSKVRGPRRDVLFINEANNIVYETFNQLEIRTNKFVFMDWNPVSEFWFYTDILGKRDDVDFITLTYLDNEGLPEAIIKTLEQRRSNSNWWRVYGEGQLGEAEGRIYTGWQVIEDVPEYARLDKYGLDFGYSNDPSTIIAIYKADMGFVFDEILYRKGMSNKDLADVFMSNIPALVIADSAEPKSIDEISSYGVKIIGAQKGKDSITHGIQYIQQQRISVTQRSTNLLKEYRNYLWLTDRDGKSINQPQDFMNHTMDAIRYAMTFQKPVVHMPQDVGGVKPYYDGLPG